MATERQIRANRVNAAKSTGPITPGSKRKVSQNSSLHRLESEAALQEGTLEGKSRRRYNALAADLTREFQPRDSTEEALVKTMTLARCRLFSMRELETTCLQREIDRARQDDPSVGFQTALALAFRNLADNPRTLLRQHRLENRYERDFFNAWTKLMNLRQTAIAQPGELHATGYADEAIKAGSNDLTKANSKAASTASEQGIRFINKELCLTPAAPTALKNKPTRTRRWATWP